MVVVLVLGGSGACVGGSAQAWEGAWKGATPSRTLMCSAGAGPQLAARAGLRHAAALRAWRRPRLVPPHGKHTHAHRHRGLAGSHPAGLAANHGAYRPRAEGAGGAGAPQCGPGAPGPRGRAAAAVRGRAAQRARGVGGGVGRRRRRRQQKGRGGQCKHNNSASQDVLGIMGPAHDPATVLCAAGRSTRAPVRCWAQRRVQRHIMRILGTEIAAGF